MSISGLNLSEDFKNVEALEEANRWILEMPNELEVLATMHPAKVPEESFQARLLWTTYPTEPPSLKFRDSNTGRIDTPTAWPILPGFRPGSLDTCVSWTVEGFNLHPEWRADSKYRWDHRGNVLLKVLRILQVTLDESFGGRFK